MHRKQHERNQQHISHRQAGHWKFRANSVMQFQTGSVMGPVPPLWAGDHDRCLARNTVTAIDLERLCVAAAAKAAHTFARRLRRRDSGIHQQMRNSSRHLPLAEPCTMHERSRKKKLATPSRSVSPRLAHRTSRGKKKTPAA